MPITLNGDTGITTPGLINTGAETVVNLTTSGNTILGDASTDTLNVGNGGLVKDASGNVGIGASTVTQLRSQLTVLGVGQNTAALTDAGATTGTIQINSNSGSTGSGGALTFGSLLDSGSYLPFAAIKGLFTTGVSNGSGDLAFSTRASSSDTALTERMRLDRFGNVGIGITPSAWYTSLNTKALQFGTTGALVAVSKDIFLSNNEYANTAGTDTYLTTGGAALQYRQTTGGQHIWYTAPSGTAGNAISFTQAMTLDASGNLLVGTTSGTQRLEVVKNDFCYGAFSTTAGTPITNVFGANSTLQIGYLGPTTNHPLGFLTNSIERMRIDTNGQLGIAVTPSPWNSAGSAVNKAIEVTSYASFSGNISNGYASVANNAYDSLNNNGWKYVSSNPASLYQQRLGSHAWLITPTGTAGNAISWTQAMTLSASGNFIVGIETDPALGTVIHQSVYSQGTTYVKLIGWGIGGTSNVSYNGQYRWYTSTGNGSVFRNGYNLQLRAFDQGQNTETTIATAVFTAWFQGNNSSTWSTTSDQRVKTNIRPISDAVDKICALNPCHFEFVNAIGEVKTNFIAQEFEQVFPNHVSEITTPEEFQEYTDSETIKTVDANLIPYLTAAIKEQQAMIDELKAKVAALEAA